MSQNVPEFWVNFQYKNAFDIYRIFILFIKQGLLLQTDGASAITSTVKIIINRSRHIAISLGTNCHDQLKANHLTHSLVSCYFSVLASESLTARQWTEPVSKILGPGLWIPWDWRPCRPMTPALPSAKFYVIYAGAEGSVQCCVPSKTLQAARYLVIGSALGSTSRCTLFCPINSDFYGWKHHRC